MGSFPVSCLAHPLEIPSIPLELGNYRTFLASKLKDMAWLKLLLLLLPVGVARADLWPADDSQHPLTSSLVSDERPNIVLILTDDQDLHMNSLDYVPLIKEHIIDRGTLFRRHFCTTAICCPSRVTLLTGKAAHNTNVTDVFPPYGEYMIFKAYTSLLERLSDDVPL